MPSKPHEVGRRLDALWRVLGKASPREFCEPLGISGSQWGNYIAGVRRLNLDTAMLIAKTYGVTLDYLYLGDTAGIARSLAGALTKLDGDKKRQYATFSWAEPSLVQRSRMRDLRLERSASEKKKAKDKGAAVARETSPKAAKKSTGSRAKK